MEKELNWINADSMKKKKKEKEKKELKTKSKKWNGARAFEPRDYSIPK